MIKDRRGVPRAGLLHTTGQLALTQQPWHEVGPAGRWVEQLFGEAARSFARENPCVRLIGLQRRATNGLSGDKNGYQGVT